MAGGTHHAMRGVGAGFCVFNDAGVAILSLLSESQIGRAVVIDCDVHQGNGTAEIFSSVSEVFTFSIHGERNFPLRKFPSDLDIDLPDGTNDLEYLDALAAGLRRVLVHGPFDRIDVRLVRLVKARRQSHALIARPPCSLKLIQSCPRHVEDDDFVGGVARSTKNGAAGIGSCVVSPISEPQAVLALRQWRSSKEREAGAIGLS